MSGNKKKNTAAKHPPVQVKNADGQPGNAARVTKWAIIAILFFTAVLYAKGLSNGFTFMDDDFYILTNPYIKNFSLKGIQDIFTTFYNYNYHPLTTLTDLFLYKCFGLDPMPYHLLNILLHLLNVWLVYKLTQQLSSNKITAIVVSILFAVHPMHVESVAWVSERKDVLYAAFYLSSLIFYLQYLNNGFRRKKYIIAFLLFLASLFSKSAAVTLPVLLIAIDVYKGRKINRKSLLEKIPFFLLSFIFGILAIKSQTAGGALTNLSLYFNLVNRVFLFTTGLSFYFIELIAPFQLNALHFFPDVSGGTLPWHYYLSLPFLVGVTWLVARKSAYRKEVIFGTMFFLITISVMLQIISVGATMTAERYTYIPYIGLFYIAGQWVSANYDKYPRVIVPAFSLILAVFTIQTWLRIDTWKDSDSLFTDTTEKNAGNWRNGLIYKSWGDSKKYQGDNEAAIQMYTEAVKLVPTYELAYSNRGNLYTKTGRPQLAVPDYTKAIALNPKRALYYNDRGWAYYQLGNKQSALSDYNTAISIDPKLSEAYNNRGWAYSQAGNTKSSVADFNTAISLSPHFIKPYFNRASIKSAAGDLAGAINDYNLILKIDPNDSMAYYNRGIIHFNQKDIAGACADWRKALELGDKNAQALIQQYCR